MKHTQHTPEPWHLVDKNKIYRRPEIDLYEFSGNVGKGIAGDRAITTTVKGWYSEDDNHFPHEANAQRIVQCVSALANIPDPAQTIPKLRRAVQLLRDLADLQNGAPLVTDQNEWTAVMAETYTLLEELE